MTLFQGKRQMESPEWELVGSATAPGLHTAGLVPFYSSAATTKGKRIPPRKMREIVREALDSTKNGGNSLRIPDPLPDAVREAVGLLPLPRGHRAIPLPRFRGNERAGAAAARL